VKQQPGRQYVVAELLNPNQNAQGKLQAQSAPTPELEDDGIAKPCGERKTPELVKMIDVTDRRPLDPGRSLRLPAKRSKIQKRQLELNHSLCPWTARLGTRILLTPADADQAIDGKICSGRRKYQEKTSQA